MPKRKSAPEPAELPPLFLERLRRIVPESVWPDVVATFSAPVATAFRANTLRTTPEHVAAELHNAGLAPRPVAWQPDAFVVTPEERAALLASAAYREGRIWVQNLSSMVPVGVLAPQPGERVLDLCAAPGSKTLQIAAAVGESGEIAAVEVVRGRFFKLRQILKDMGAGFVRTFHQDGTNVDRYRPEYFDRVLLDAPCSTEARFRADDPETYRYWRPRKIKEMQRKQQRLLYAAIQSLRPGGTLVYSTCSFGPEENEAVLSRMLEKFGDAVEAVPLALPFDNVQTPLPAWDGEEFLPATAQARRILPTTKMEGFFVAKLEKHASTA